MLHMRRSHQQGRCHHPGQLPLLLTVAALLLPWGVIAFDSPGTSPSSRRPPSPQPFRAPRPPQPPPSPQPKPPPSAIGIAPPANRPSITVSLEGTLTYRTSAPNGTWLLSLMDGKNSYLLPGQPIDAQSNLPIAPGNLVSLTCILSSPLTKECTVILGGKISKLLSSEVNTVNVTIRLLVVIVSLDANRDCDTINQPTAKETVYDAFLASNGMVNFFSGCSYGRMTIDRDVLKVISVNLSCSELLMLPCWNWAMPMTLSTFVKDKLKLETGIALGSFSHIAHVIPNNPSYKCSWRGMADLPGTNTWFTPEPKGIFGKGTVMQELLHNFGMYHGYDQDDREYEDYSTAMGRGDSCPSAPELWRLGWAEPLVELNSTSLPAATFKTFILRATYLGPEGAMIKIKPDWLGSFYNRNLYLALRVKAGGDRDLLDQFDGKLNIHRVQISLDTRFKLGADPKISLIGVVSPTTSWNYSDYKLQIVTGDLISQTSSIVVKICRYINSLQECISQPGSPPVQRPPPLRPPPRPSSQPGPFPKSPNPPQPSSPRPKPGQPSPLVLNSSPPNPRPPNESPMNPRPEWQPPTPLANVPCNNITKDGTLSCGGIPQPRQPRPPPPPLPPLPPAPPTTPFTPGVVQCGYENTCVLSTEGTIKCFGYSYYGPGGMGRENRPGTMGPYLPTVDLGTNLKATAVVTRGSHTCALLQPGGIIKCWGENYDGQLGLGDTNIRGDSHGEMGSNLPAVDLGTGGLTATAITAGGRHTCALLQPGGVVKCWGNNGAGQLGLGDSKYNPRGDGPGEMGSNLPAVDLGTGGLTVTAITAGSGHTCALLQPGGVVKCWGGNSYGQLGLGDYTSRGDMKGQMGDNLPTVNLGPGYNATAIAAGASMTCALLQPGGAVKCWGNNGVGQLGQGDTSNRTDPSAIQPIDLGKGYTATAIATGDSHACALLQPGGIIKCWGYNGNGRLGLGDTNWRGDQPNEMGDNLPPVDLGPGLTATAVAAGASHTCALLQPGSIIKCWGHNFYGQLGQEDTTSRGDDLNEMGTNLPPVSLQ